MSNIFTKIISGDKKKDKEKEKTEPKKEKSKKVVSEEKSEKTEVKQKKTEGSASYRYSKKSILKKPLITEKSRDMSMKGKYVFSVDLNTNKSEVKKEIQKRYGVTVEGVNIIKKGIRPKKFRGQGGKIKMQKKAVVTLKEGDSIEIFPV